MTKVCTYCGEELKPWAHWALCPVHDKSLLARVHTRVPTIREEIEKRQGRPMLIELLPQRRPM